MSTLDDIRVFFVDDHSAIRDGYRSVLEINEGFAVSGEANSGEEALEKLPATKTDLAIVDLSMDGMGGLELIRRLKAEGEASQKPPLKVLIVTVYGRTSTVEDAFEAGARGYLLKQNAHTGLTDAIRTVNGGDRYLDRVLTDKVNSDRLDDLPPNSTKSTG